MGEEFFPPVRLNDVEQLKLLEHIRAQQDNVKNSKRVHDRIECHLTNVHLVVIHPDGELARFLVSTRNISTNGLSFLHGGFLYPGCRCKITLPTVWGGHETLAGNIVACRYIEKRIHELGMVFDMLIDRRRFVTLPGERVLENKPDSSKITALRGRVLVVDKCKVNVNLAQHHIKDSKVEMVAAETILEGIVAVRSAPIDTVLLDIDSSDQEPGELILEFRDAGYKGPIVCTTTKLESSRSQAALAAGADEVIARPITASNLVRVLTECLSGGSGVNGPVWCQLESSPDTVELITNYLSYIETLSSNLAEGIEKEDFEKILKSCRVISQSAGGYGFPSLEQAAMDALQALKDSNSVPESIHELQRLRSICAKLEPVTLDSI